MIRFFSTAAVVAMLASGVAQAAPAGMGDTYSVTIRTGDLDLASGAGQATFRGRVNRAADEACGVPAIMPLAQYFAVTDCRASLRRAVQGKVEVVLARRSVDTGSAGTR